MALPKILVFNNIVSPYTSRLWSSLSSVYKILVVSCSGGESNRNWSDDIANDFQHKILRGFCIKLSPARFAHVNIGFRKEIIDFNPDLVVCNGFYPTMLGVALICRLRKIPYVIQNDGWKETMPESVYHGVIRPLILKYCRAVIACSEKGAVYFRSQGIPKTATFVAHLAPAWDEPVARPSYAARKYDLLWVAQINKTVKNCEFFVSVVQELVKMRPGLRVCVVGDGPDRVALTNQLSVQDAKIDYYTKVRWDKISEIFLQSRLLLLPSLWEPWGLVCNEAMQSGTPCIVSKHVGAAGELVKITNGVVEDLEEKKWAAACERLLEPTIWQRYSSDAVAASRRFNFDNYLAGYITAFNAILAPNEVIS